MNVCRCLNSLGHALLNTALQAMARSSSSWRAGQSGNPAGRKSGDPAITKSRRAIARELPAIIAKLVELAKAGDTRAAAILINKLIPDAKADYELLESRIAQLEEQQP